MFFNKNKSSGLTAEIRVKRCYGCGAILQDSDPNEIGYLPTAKLNSDEECLCERCFKLRHYSSLKKENELNIDYVTILQTAKEEKALCAYVLNAFALESSLIKGIGKYLPENLLVIINKRDILGKAISDETLLKNAKSLLEEEGIKAQDIIIASASSRNMNIDLVLNKVNEKRAGKNVYFIGGNQVGKSSLINCLLSHYTNQTEKTITTSPYPGTTLDVISIPLDENSYIYDTPGLTNENSLIANVSPEAAKRLSPRNEIKPEIYPSRADQSILFSNFARLDFVKGDKANFTIFKSNDLTLERAKINKADELFNGICKNPNISIKNDRVSSISQLKKINLKAIAGKTNCLRIYGLGFILFEGKDQELSLYVPEKVTVTLKAED